MPNRRKHARKALRRNAHLLFPDRPSILIRTTDISKGGLGAIADVNLLPGTSCTVIPSFAPPRQNCPQYPSTSRT